MVASRQGTGCVYQLALADDAAQAELAGTLTAQGLHPIEQINRYCFRSVHFRAPGGVLFEMATDDPGFTGRRKRPWATRSSCHLGTSPAAPRSWRRSRRCADRRRGNASRGDGEPQNSFLRDRRAVYSFSARTRTKQLCLCMGMRRKRSVHSRRLSPRILALTLPLIILPTQ
jgi:hypothetical protein